MSVLKGLNLVLAFALELVMLAACALGVWSLTGDAGWPTVARVAAAAAALALVGLVWGRWLAPRAARPLTGPWTAVGKLAVFVLVGVLLAVAGWAGWGAALVAAAAVNLALERVWGQI